MYMYMYIVHVLLLIVCIHNNNKCITYAPPRMYMYMCMHITRSHFEMVYKDRCSYAGITVICMFEYNLEFP